MIKFDLWYGHSLKDVNAVNVSFYPNDSEYRGNVYKDGKAIGDFVSNDSVQVEIVFPGIFGD